MILKSRIWILFLVAAFVLTLQLYSCRSTRPAVYVSPSCDETPSYSSVQTLLTRDCATTCHSEKSAKSGVVLSDYGHVKVVAQSGKLLCVLTGPNDCPRMPPFGNGMTKEEVTLIDCWIQGGMAE